MAIPTFARKINPQDYLVNDPNGAYYSGYTPEGYRLQPTATGYELWSNAQDNWGPEGNAYGQYWQGYDAEGNAIGDQPRFENAERSNGFIGDNLDIIGPLAVAGFAGWGAGLFGGMSGGAGASSAATAGGTAVSEGASLLEVLQTAAASNPELAATLTEAGLYGSEAVNAALISSIGSNPSILAQIGETLKNLPSGVKNLLTNTIKSLFGDGVASTIGSVLSGAAPIAAAALNLAGAYDQMNRMRDLGDSLQKQYGQLGDDAYNTYNQAGENANAKYGQVGTDAADKWTTLGTKIGGDLSALGRDTSTAWKDLGAQTADRWKQAGTDVKGLFDQTADKSKQGWQDIGKEYQTQYTDLGAAGKADYTTLGQDFNTKYGTLGTKVQGMFDTVGAAGNSRLTGVGDEYEGKFASLGSEYEGKASGIANSAKSMAGTFTPFAVTTNLGNFGSDGKWTLNAANQGVADAATGVARKSFDEAGKFDLGNIRQQEFDIMQGMFNPVRQRELLANESRQRAQGRLGVQSLNEADSFEFTDPITGQKSRIGANPADIAMYKGWGEADLKAYLDADDNAMKRYAGLIGAGNAAMETPIALNDAGLRAGQLAGDLGTRAFDARRSAADLWQQGMFKGLDYGFGAKGEGLNKGYTSGMEGARFENTNAVEGVRENADLLRTGLDTEYKDTRAGIDYDLGARKTGIDTALGTAKTGQQSWDTLTGEGIDAYGNRLDKGLTGQDTAEGKAITEKTRIDEKAIDFVANTEGKGIEEVRNATNKGLDAYKSLWESGQREKLDAIENGIKAKFGSEKEALRALSQIYNAASRQLGGMFGTPNAATSPGASIASAIGNFFELFKGSGMTEEQTTQALQRIVEEASNAYEEFGLETDLTGLFEDIDLGQFF